MHSDIPFRTMADGIQAGQEFAASFADGSWKTDVQCSVHRLLTIADYGSTFLPTDHGPVVGATPELTDQQFADCCGSLGSGKLRAIDWKSLIAKAIALVQLLLPLLVTT